MVALKLPKKKVRHNSMRSVVHFIVRVVIIAVIVIVIVVAAAYWLCDGEASCAPCTCCVAVLRGNLKSCANKHFPQLWTTLVDNLTGMMYFIHQSRESFHVSTVSYHLVCSCQPSLQAVQSV